MVKREFEVAVEKGEDGGYSASVTGLPGCDARAKNLEQLMPRVREAVLRRLEADGHDPGTGDDLVLRVSISLPAPWAPFPREC